MTTAQTTVVGKGGGSRSLAFDTAAMEIARFLAGACCARLQTLLPPPIACLLAALMSFQRATSVPSLQQLSGQFTPLVTFLYPGGP